MGSLPMRPLSGGAKVTGIIPGFLQVKEVAHGGLTEMITVDTMHDRKALIYEKAMASLHFQVDSEPWMSFLKCSPGASWVSTRNLLVF